MLLINNLFIYATLCITLVQVIKCDKILGLLNVLSRSHFIVHEPLLRELAVRGHEVTVYTYYEQTGPKFPNLRWITIEEDEGFNIIRKGLLKGAESNKSTLMDMPELISATATASVNALKHSRFEELKKESFDLVINAWFLNDFQIGVAGHFRCPSVVVSSTHGMKSLREYAGNPDEFATVPFLMLGYKGQMNFAQRIINFLAKSAEFIFTKLLYYFVHEPKYRELFPPNKYPSYDEVRRNVSLVLINDHFSQGSVTANVPGYVEVAGLHIKDKPNPLPEDIREFLDSASEGVIYFSLGSNINSAQMPAEKRTAILSAFSKIKVKVLWKFEDENLPNKPSNVKIGKWLPQDDILAHPNVRAFLSHCGKGSLNEAKYHGVPILGMPIFADQPSNLEAILQEGWAVPLDYSTLSEQSLLRGINEILTNDKYRKVVKTASDLFKDRPQSPLETAVFWVEYVLRHKGAKHMQSNAVHLNWFQYHSLDVIAVLLIGLYVAWKIVKISFKLIFGKCLRTFKLKRE